MNEYYLFMNYILFFVLIIIYGQYTYYKAKFEESQENNKDLVEEIRWLHLDVSEERYKEFYKE